MVVAVRRRVQFLQDDAAGMPDVRIIVLKEQRIIMKVIEQAVINGARYLHPRRQRIVQMLATEAHRIEYVVEGEILPVEAFGRTGLLPGKPETLADDVIDAGDRWITPGLIDCHTHMVFGGSRAGEFEKRLQGVSYEEIARAGGGIDAVSSTIGGSSLNVSGLVGEDEKIARTKETVESGLGGRDPVVLIARELLYRTCETAMNLELNTEQSLDLYKTTLQAIQSIAESHSNDGTSSDAAQMLNLPSNE